MSSPPERCNKMSLKPSTHEIPSVRYGILGGRSNNGFSNGLGSVKWAI